MQTFSLRALGGTPKPLFSQFDFDFAFDFSGDVAFAFFGF